MREAARRSALQRRRDCCLTAVVAVALTWLAVFTWRMRQNILQRPPSPGILFRDRLNATGLALRDGLSRVVHGIKLWDRPQHLGPMELDYSHVRVGAKDIHEFHNNTDSSEVHIIFSTDCKPFMDYQTLVLFHSAVLAGHRGPVTRIVSGCKDSKESFLKSLYAKLYPKYHVHFTPDFAYDPVKKVRYVYFNKPYGLKHWLEHADPPVGADTIVCLLDPDMILLRPITPEIRGLEGLDPKIPVAELFDRVTRGKPAAAVYGLGAPWTTEGGKYFRKRDICPPGSPCLTTTTEFGERHFSVGPPYMVHRDDMLRIADSWSRFAKPVHSQYPELLAEMYAYSIAAAHESLPHLQVSTYMVSNIHMDNEEGWQLVDALSDVCETPQGTIFQPGRPLPLVLHHCQNYRAGLMGWAKRRPELLGIFSCDSGLLLEPPSDLGFLDWKMKEGKVIFALITSNLRMIYAIQRTTKPRKQIKRNAFMICVTHRMVNAAATYYKQMMCTDREANYSKVIKLEPVGG